MSAATGSNKEPGQNEGTARCCCGAATTGRAYVGDARRLAPIALRGALSSFAARRGQLLLQAEPVPVASEIAEVSLQGCPLPAHSHWSLPSPSGSALPSPADILASEEQLNSTAGTTAARPARSARGAPGICPLFAPAARPRPQPWRAFSHTRSWRPTSRSTRTSWSRYWPGPPPAVARFAGRGARSLAAALRCPGTRSCSGHRAR